MIMENKKNFVDFTSYENYKHQIEIWYRAYNISREKMELFHDFLISLYELVDNTYLGSDVISTDDDIKGHFNWCWDKVIDNFNKEKIYFKNRGNCHEYFWNFFLEAFYFNKIENKRIRIDEYVNMLFDIDYLKNRSELDVVTEIYRLLDQNLKK
jgi:hypothetical protein